MNEVGTKELENITVTYAAVSPWNHQSEARVRGFLRMFDEAEAKVHLVAHLPHGKRFGIECELNGVTLVLPSRCPRWLKGLLVVPFNFVCTLWYARKSEVVLTSCGSMIVNAPVIFAAKVARKPLIYDWLDVEVEPIPRRVFEWLIKKPDIVLCCSHYLIKEMARIECPVKDKIVRRIACPGCEVHNPNVLATKCLREEQNRILWHLKMV